jgi:hypothetical protein
MLTGRQLMTMTTLRREPPYRFQELRNIFDIPSPRPLSIRAIINGVQSQKLLFFVQVRDISILKSSTTLDELKASWNSSAPTQETLKQLARFLQTFGAFIVFVSTDKKIVGITGHVEPLMTMPVMRLTIKTFQQGRDAASAEVAVGGALIGIAGIPGAAPAAPILLAVGAGLLLGAAIGYIYIIATEDDEPPVPVAASGQQPVDPASGAIIPDVVMYGTQPDGSAGPSLVDDPPISFEIPDVPPPPDGSPPDGSPP